MTLSDNLYRLADRAKEAEAKAAKAQENAARNAKQARADLEQSVNESRASAEAQAAKFRDDAKASKDKLSAWWDQQQEAWNAHLAKVREDMDQRKSEHDVKHANRRADRAEADAEFAVDYAYAALEEAEYAVLDAFLSGQTPPTCPLKPAAPPEPSRCATGVGA